MLVRIINKDGVVSEYNQNKDLITFGRDATNDIVVDDEKVSKKHLIIVKEQGLLRAKDLGSTNGTFVNGKPIEYAVVLNIGDKVAIGARKYHVRR